VILEGSRAFWEEIERRRKSPRPRRSLEEVRERLALPAGKSKKAG
jgi:hypothetical protein